MKFLARRADSIVPIEVEQSGSGYLLRVGDREFAADLIRANGHLHSLRLRDGRHYLLTHQRQGNTYSISFGGREVQLDLLDPLDLRRGKSEEAKQGASERVRAVMPGRVVRVLVEVGAEVKSGEGLLILEAMKMENEITAPHQGKVSAVYVQAGQTVESGADLVDIE